METEIHSGFVRQRRNLMVMSVVVLLSEVANLRINKISIFGNEASISNPEIVNVALWILLIYWLIRYYQYFYEMGDKGFLTSLKSKRAQLVKRWFFRKLVNNHTFTKSLPNQNGEKLRVFPREVNVFRDYWFFITAEVEFLIGIDATAGTIEKKDLTIKGWLLFIPTLLSLIHVFTRTRYFSEYILPFILFLLPWYFSFPSHQSWLMAFIKS